MRHLGIPPAGLRGIMSQEKEDRDRRNYVSKMYPYPAWQEKVAHMSRDRVTAIYLRFIRTGQKPLPEPSPEIPEPYNPDDEDDDDDQLQLFSQ